MNNTVSYQQPAFRANILGKFSGTANGYVKKQSKGQLGLNIKDSINLTGVQAKIKAENGNSNILKCFFSPFIKGKTPNITGNNPSANLSNTYIPTILKEFQDEDSIPTKFFNKIVSSSDLDVNTKASCLRYVEQAEGYALGTLSRFIEVRRAIRTVNKILSNPNIDKRCVSAILNSCQEKDILQNYEKLAQYKLEPMTRYTLALMNNVNAKNVQEFSDFTDAVLKVTEKTPSNCSEIAYYIMGAEGKDFDLRKLTEYVKSVDKSKLVEIAPSIKEYSAQRYINFLNFHRQKGVVNFNKESLTLNEDLTKFMEENPIMLSQGTKDLLTAYPLTKTRVGSMPEFFNVKDVDSKKIFEITEQLANNLEINRYKVVDANFEQSLLNQYKSDLQSLLKKDVAISRLGNGSFGMTYKLSIQGEKPIVIKLFYKDRSDPQSGSFVEIPLAIFTNKHFPEHFAKFYFGKIPANNGENGFMVSEFLTPSPKGQFPKIQDEKWSFIYGDGHDWNDGRGNIIGGKICDFGYVEILQKNNKEDNAKRVERASLKLFKY